jgi:predicted Zn-dependent protease
MRTARCALVLGFAGLAFAADPVAPPPGADAAAQPPSAAAADTAVRPEVSPAMMLRAAKVVYDRDVQRARAANSIDETSDTSRRIRAAAERLTMQAIRVSPGVPWTLALTVENESMPVAYCLPGGKIIASNALVDRMRLTDAELAAVLAHAMGHAIAGHDADEAIVRLKRMPDGISADPNRTVLNLAEILAQLVHKDPHTVDAERVADSISLDLLLRAGIDPHAAVEAWRKVARAGGAVPPSFLALNPTWSTRVDDLDAAIPAAIRSYQASLVAPPAPAAPPKEAKKRKPASG